MSDLSITSISRLLTISRQKGWRFATPEEKLPGENTTPDPINGYSHLRKLYFESDPEYKGRFTVPTLYDKKAKQIVSNEVGIILNFSKIHTVVGGEVK